ncbi:MAG: hypothetical protein QOI66_856 [Myxococcales bacterium]|jgi:hypothetical protein|nr:hypothetical protein [Myxococcales bacterium]
MQQVRVDTCGCASEMRRVCDLCAGDEGMFAACSLACLGRHLSEKHGGDAGARASTETRARQYLGGVNRRLAGSWQRYQDHRGHVLALALAAETAPAADVSIGDIAIFGAGNGSDLDLPRLAHSFREIHLIDLDGDALERARQDLPAAVRERVIPHAPVDLSGFMSHLDDWGESFPDDAALGQTAFAAARAIMDGLGRGFDVVLSTGVLSQLIVPFHRAWIASRLNWERLDAAIIAVHLATLVGSLRPGGRGALAFDVLSSKDAPMLSALVNRGSAELETAVETEVAAGHLTLRPHPTTLLQQLQFSGMASMVQEPRLTAPWLWNLGDAVQLVYGLLFRRP